MWARKWKCFRWLETKVGDMSIQRRFSAIMWSFHIHSPQRCYRLLKWTAATRSLFRPHRQSADPKMSISPFKKVNGKIYTLKTALLSLFDNRLHPKHRIPNDCLNKRVIFCTFSNYQEFIKTNLTLPHSLKRACYHVTAESLLF